MLCWCNSDKYSVRLALLSHDESESESTEPEPETDE